MVNLNYTNETATVSRGRTYLHTHFSWARDYYGVTGRSMSILQDGTIVGCGKVNNNNQSGVTRRSLNGNVIWAWRQNNNDCYAFWADETTNDCFIGNDSGQVWSLNLETGEENWGPVDIGNACRCINGYEGDSYIFAVENGGSIKKLSKTDGSDLGLTSPTATAEQYCLAADDTYFYAAENSNTTLYRCTKATGAIDSQCSLDSNARGVYIDGNYVYIGTDAGWEKWDAALTTTNYPDEGREWSKSDGGTPYHIESVNDNLIAGGGVVRQKSDGRYVGDLRNQSGLKQYLDGTWITGHSKHGWERFRKEENRVWQGRYRYPHVPVDVTNDTYIPVWENNYIRVRDRETGNDVWYIDISDANHDYYFSNVVEIDDNKNLFASIVPGGRIDAYDAGGKDLFTFNFSNDDVVTRMIGDGSGGIYYGSKYGDVGHIDNTGTQTYSVNHFSGPVHNMDLIDGTLYACGWKEVNAIDPANGTANWTYTDSDWVFDATVNGDNGDVYVAVDDNYVRRVNGTDGTFVEQHEVKPRKEDSWNCAMAIDWEEGFFYIGGVDGYVRKCSDEMVYGWQHADNGGCITSMQVADGEVAYVNSDSSSRITRDWPIYVAEKKSHVTITTADGSDIFYNGVLMDRFRGGTKQKEFILNAGDVLSSRDSFYINGILIE